MGEGPILIRSLSLKSLNNKEESAVNQTDFINILDFGAVPDGRTLCTDAFSAAVAACKKREGERSLFRREIS